MLYSVCVATYKRPDLLKELLQDLIEQEVRAGDRCEVIVVDNDEEQSAADIVRSFQQRTRGISYLSEPTKNISLARNTAVRHARGNYILFIDDDERPEPEWIRTMVQTLEKYEADGVFGRVVPNFHPRTPEWIRRGPFFYEPFSKIRTGERATMTWTGNCILKASLIKDMVFLFDPRYGTTGGEDSDLFERLMAAGAKFVYCYEAWVKEFIPPNRTTVRYMLQRSLRVGSNRARKSIEAAGTRRLSSKVAVLSVATLSGFVSLLLMILTFPSEIARTYWSLRLAYNIGRVTAVFDHVPQDSREWP